eukprot:UN06332
MDIGENDSYDCQYSDGSFIMIGCDAGGLYIHDRCPAITYSWAGPESCPTECGSLASDSSAWCVDDMTGATVDNTTGTFCDPATDR